MLDSDEVAGGNEKPSAQTVRRIENALRASGMPRSEAMRLISDFKASLSDSAGDGERDATNLGDGSASAISSTISSKISSRGKAK